jgi:NAD(P)-dependent dehydrogenase (short-subunit alcohol dehydrogenase family)
MENADFAGRVAVVTGAWRGLGRAAAARLHERGASVAVNVRNRERAEAMAKKIGERAFAVPGDVAADGVPDEIARRTLERFGRIDILVNNAAASAVNTLPRSHCRGMAQSDRGQPHRAVLDDESGSSANARPALRPHH